MSAELPPSMALLWLHFSFVGLATAVYARQRNVPIGIALIGAASIAIAMFVMNSSLSSMVNGLLDEKANRSASSNLVKGSVAIVYLFPFVISQVAFASISCVATMLLMKVFSLFVGLQSGEDRLQSGGFRFNLSFLFFSTAIIAIAFTQLLSFVRNKSF